MARTIIVHVGTSILKGKLLREHVTFDLNGLLSDLDRGREAGSERLNQALADLNKSLSHLWNINFDIALRRQESPAEVASLSLLGINADDRIVLLHSDTASGRACSTLLAAVLSLPHIPAETAFPYCVASSVTPVQIDGLRVTDDLMPGDQSQTGGDTYTDSFIRQGVVKYVAVICEQYRVLKPGAELVFNVTGGYKGMIPIARDLALLLAAHSRQQQRGVSCSLCYLYETGNAIIVYPVIPIQFDLNAVPHKLLAKVDQPGGLDAVLLIDNNTKQIDPSLEPFFEPLPSSRNMRRSALGEVVWELYKRLRVANAAVPIVANS